MEIENLPDEIEQRLNDLATETGKTPDYFVREALLEYLDDLEDIHLAEQAMQRLRRGETRTVPLEKVMRDLDLAN